MRLRTNKTCPSLKQFNNISNRDSTLFVMLLILISIINFSGCKDDPVTVDGYVFAAPRFNWRTIDINNAGGVDIWARDTNRIYLLDDMRNSLFVITGGNANQYNTGNYDMFSMTGVSENELIIFGLSPESELTFIKWNGGGFEYFPSGVYLPEYFERWFLGCVGNQNESWICSKKGIVKLEGNTVTTYSYPDSTMNFNDIFRSSDNKIQIICEGSLPGQYVQKIYELQDTAFVQTFEFMEPLGNTNGRILIKELNGITFGLTFNQNDIYGMVCFKHFNGTGFTDNFCLDAGLYNIKVIAGSNFQDFSIIASTDEYVFENTQKGLLYWDGFVLSREVELPVPMILEYDFKLISANESTFLVMYDSGASTRILAGTRK